MCRSIWEKSDEKEKIVVQDELLARVGVALRRAAKRAKEIAAQTNTPIIVFENGKVVKKKVTKKQKGGRPGNFSLTGRPFLMCFG